MQGGGGSREEESPSVPSFPPPSYESLQLLGVAAGGDDSDGEWRELRNSRPPSAFVDDGEIKTTDCGREKEDQPPSVPDAENSKDAAVRSSASPAPPFSSLQRLGENDPSSGCNHKEDEDDEALYQRRFSQLDLSEDEDNDEGGGRIHWRRSGGGSLVVDAAVGGPNSESFSSLSPPPVALSSSADADADAVADNPGSSSGGSPSGQPPEVRQFELQLRESSGDVPVATPLPSAQELRDENEDEFEDDEGGGSMLSGPRNDGAGGDGAGHLHEAEVMHADVVEPTRIVVESGGRGMARRKRIYVVVSAALLVIVAVAVGLGVALMHGKDANPPAPAGPDPGGSAGGTGTSSTTTTGAATTTAATMTTETPPDGGVGQLPPVVESDRLVTLRQFLSSAAYGGAEDEASMMFNSTTPQYQALSWLADADLADLSPFAQEEQDRIVQRYALAAVYFSAGGDGWDDSANFLSESDECLWSSDKKGELGVFCDEKGAVKVLNLDENNLRGTIPGPELALLSPSLMELRAVDNRLSGTLPPEIGLLRKLFVVYLDRNNLAGSLPSELGEIPELFSVRLHKNKFSGMLPPELGDFYRLDYLDLSRNRFTGTVPDSYRGLGALSFLDLSHNFLTGSVEFICEDLIIGGFFVDLDEVACTCCACC